MRYLLHLFHGITVVTSEPVEISAPFLSWHYSIFPLSLPVNRLRYLRHFFHSIIRFIRCRHQPHPHTIIFVDTATKKYTNKYFLLLHHRNIPTQYPVYYFVLSILQYSTGICTNVNHFNFIPLFLITKFYCFVRTCSSCKFLFI